MIDLKTVSSFPCLGYLTPKSGLNSTNERRDVEDQRLRGEREREEEEEAEQVDLPF
ncbi:hypothetical protein RUM44_002096 [Polyplax serrata]|uniref:Uncharacterized protein n=1 Tax=Polyplax serrata TaxID=468196 RepID=A0ABR1ALX9_POLSC